MQHNFKVLPVLHCNCREKRYNTFTSLSVCFRVKELKKDTPGTPNPRPVTVPTTIAETDRLLSVNGTTVGLPRLDKLQVIQCK